MKELVKRPSIYIGQTARKFSGCHGRREARGFILPN